jgi:hypothetical protein
MPKNLPKTRATMSREIMYDDHSGPRTAVQYDSHYRLGDDPERFVQIEGVGGEISVHLIDVPFLIEALQLAQELDEEAHS